LFAFECDAASVAVDVDFEDRGVMDEAIHGGERHGGVWKTFPHARRLVGRDERGSTLVSALISSKRTEVSA